MQTHISNFATLLGCPVRVIVENGKVIFQSNTTVGLNDTSADAKDASYIIGLSDIKRC